MAPILTTFVVVGDGSQYVLKKPKKLLQNVFVHAIIACVSVPGNILGCRQAVRHQTLTLAFVGSNPAIPAKKKASLATCFFLLYTGILCPSVGVGFRLPLTKYLNFL